MISGISTVNILGFHTSSMSREEILSTVATWMEEKVATRHLMALNPIKVCRARKETRLANHIMNADLVYPDAFGIAWAMRVQGLKKQEPIPGCDLMFDIMDMAAKNQKKVYLLGASSDIVRQTVDAFSKKYPGAILCGYHSGYFLNTEEENATISEIMTLRPDIVFVAMGALIQENWIEKIKKEADRLRLVIPLLMGVGGSFDAVTGNVARPPRWMLRSHLEWLYRLLQQPFRAPRMIALPTFAILTLLKHWFHMDLDYRMNVNTDLNLSC